MKSEIVQSAIRLCLQKTTSHELTLATTALCNNINGVFGSVVTEIANGNTYTDAISSDRRRQQNKTLSILDGIPISLKDNFNVEQSRTTAGSRMLDNYVSPFDSTVAERLRRHGAVLCAKANLDEFGMGSSMSNSAFGSCTNPWTRPGQPALTPGGSSGASAVLVASGVVAAAIGSDTGGSVRLPASFCGVVGFKPTYGAISRHGLISYASSLDTPGIITRSVVDAAIMFDVLAGSDHRDMTTLQHTDSAAILPQLISHHHATIATSNQQHLESILTAAASKVSLQGIVVGVPDEFVVEELDNTVRLQWQEALRMLQEAGAEVRSVSVPSLKLALPCYYVLACAEASSNLSRYDGVRYGVRASRLPSELDESETPFRHASQLHDMIALSRTEGFGPEVIKRVLTGTFVLSESASHDYFYKAAAIRDIVRRDLRNVLSSSSGGVHVLVGPTAPLLPFPHSAPPSALNMMLNDLFTVPANLAGIPAISVPIGVSDTSNGGSRSYSNSPSVLPVGMQLMGPPSAEAMLLRTALALEQRVNFASLTPTYVTSFTANRYVK